MLLILYWSGITYYLCLLRATVINSETRQANQTQTRIVCSWVSNVIYCRYIIFREYLFSLSAEPKSIRVYKNAGYKHWMRLIHVYYKYLNLRVLIFAMITWPRKLIPSEIYYFYSTYGSLCKKKSFFISCKTNEKLDLVAAYHKLIPI